MTTARDVIAKLLCEWEGQEEPPDKLDLMNADAFIKRLLSAPDSVRLELAGLLNPWRGIDSAPRDGTPFLAWCIERAPFSPAPTWSYDIAKWSGRTPDDRAGHFASRSGAIVVHWLPLPTPPRRTSR